MFRKENRLPRGIIFSKKAAYFSKYFLIKSISNKEGKLRFGFVISKRIDKRAVVRNKIRRQLKRCISDLYNQIKPGNDILFIIKKEILKKTDIEICKETESAFKKIKIIT